MAIDWEEERTCPECGKTVQRGDMLWTYDCHGIPFKLVCSECAEKMTAERGYAGEYYDESDECLDYDY